MTVDRCCGAESNLVPENEDLIYFGRSFFNCLIYIGQVQIICCKDFLIHPSQKNIIARSHINLNSSVRRYPLLLHMVLG